MADFTIEGGLVINSSAAIQSVASIGRKIDEMFVKLNKPIDFDTKPAEDDLKRLAKEADAIEIDAKVGKVEMPDVPKGGLFDGIGGSLASLVSPAGLATAGIAALGAGLTYAFDVGQKFEQGMAGLGAITGLSGQALDDIGTRAQDLAVKFGGSVTTQIESFQGILSKFGADLAKTPEDLGKVSESVNILAKAGGIDAATAMNTLTGAMLQFGVNTSNSSELAAESARFINVMAASARVGAAEIPQVGEAITVAGVAMKGAKVSFEEGNAAIQVLAAGGKVGAEAGTALRNVLGKIAGEEVIPKEALAKLKSLGVDMKLVSNTALPLETRLKELKKASGDATAFAQVFGTENAAAASILANGAETVGKWTAEITGTSDATTQAAINMNTLSERINRGKAAFEAFSINIFKVLNPILSSVIGAITDAFGKVQAALAPIFSKLGATFGALFTRLKPVFAAIAGFIGGAWLAQITTYFAAVGTVLNVLFSTAVKIFDGIVAALQPIVDAFKKAFDITDTVESSFDPLKLFGDILSGITDIISFVGDVLVELGGFLVEFLITPMKLGFTVVSLLIQPLVDLGKWIFNVGESTEKTGGFFSDFIDIVKQAPEFIRAVTAGFSAFVGSITDLITNFSFEKLGKVLKGETFGEAFGSSMGQSAVKKANETLLGGFEGSMKKLSDLAEKINLSNSEQEKRFNLAAQELQKKFNKVDFEAEKELLSAKSKQQKDAIEKRVAAQKEAITKDYEAQKKAITKDLELQKEKDKVSFNTEKVRINDQITAKLAAKEIDKKTEEKLRAQLLDINLAAETKADAANKANDDKKTKDKKDKGKKDNDDAFKLWLENRKLLDEAEVKAIADDTERALRASELKEDREIAAVRNTINETRKATDKDAATKKTEIALLEKQITAISLSEQANRLDIVRKEDEKDGAKRRERLAKAHEKETADLLKRQEKDREEYRKSHQKEIEERIAAEEKYAETHKSIFQQLADNTIDIFKGISDGFTSAFTVDDSAAKEATATARKEADKQLTELKKSLKDKAISFSDYQDKVTDINRQIEETGAEAGKSFGDKFVDGLNKSLGSVGKVFDRMGDGILNQLEADNKEYYQLGEELAKQKKLQEKFSATDTEEQAKERQKEILKIERKQNDSTVGFAENTNRALESLAISTTGTLLQMASTGTLTLKAAGQAAAGIALDTVSKLVMVQAPAILAIFTASIPPPFGFIAGIAALATVQVALAAVKGAIAGGSGFFKGGDTRDTPVGKVAGVVHGNEVIVNHEEVHGEFDVFEKVRGTLKGGVHMSEIYNAWENSKRPALSDVFVGMNGIIPNYQLTPQPIQIPVVSDYGTVSEIRAQTAVLSNKLDAVLEATEAMPSGFRGNIKMDANIKLDKGAMLKEVTYNNRRKALQ